MNLSWETTCAGGSAVRYKLRRKILSQNFLYNRSLIDSLVRGSSIGQNDIVVEIGPGKGFITSRLLSVAKKVIAVELDEKLVLHLRAMLGGHLNLNLVSGDFLRFELPRQAYKVFANIPFSIEGEIVRKLLDSENPPEDCYVVVMKELAMRLSGFNGQNQFSMKHQLWFDFEIYHQFRRSDFIPIPSVDCVMWRITKKAEPLLPWGERMAWEKFIEKSFGEGRKVKQNLRQIMSAEQLKVLSGKLNFSLDVLPNRLTLEQWLTLYRCQGDV